MKKLLFVLLAASATASAVSVSGVKVVQKSHSDALIGFNFSGWGGNLRWRWTTAPTACTGFPANSHQTQLFNQTGSQLSSGGSYYQLIATNLPPSTTVNLCVELNSTDKATDWAVASVSFTTDSLPAQHPALPKFDNPAIPTEPDMTGACVWTVGGTTTTCTGSTTPDCSTYIACWNAAMDQQAAHKTVIVVPKGTEVVHRNWIYNVAQDVQTVSTSNIVSTGITLTNSFAEGQGIVFGSGYGMAWPSNAGVKGGDSFEGACDGLRSGKPFYVHHPSGSAPWSDLQLTCNKPYSQGGKLIHLSNQGSGTLRYALYPRVGLNYIETTTDATATQLPPSGVRVTPAYVGNMAKFRADSTNALVSQDGFNNILSSVFRFGNFDSGYNGGNDMMPARQWFKGIEVSSVSGASERTDPIGNAFTQHGIIIGPDSMDIFFDRCYIHGLPFPERMFVFLEWEGQNTGFINSYMENFVSGIGMGDACDAARYNGALDPNGGDAPNMVRSSIGPGPLIWYNNFLEGTGIPIHFDGGGEWLDTSNILVQRSYFKLLRKYVRVRSGTCPDAGPSPYPEDPLWDGRHYATRQPLEFKGAHKIKIDGNIFDTATRSNSVSTITMTSVTRQGIYDVDITNNTFEHVYAGITANSTGGGTLHTRPMDRIRIQNNLLFDLNGDHYNGWVNHTVTGFAGKWDKDFGGYFLNGFQHSEDVIVDHNTVTINASAPAGLEPGLINVKEAGSEAFYLTNNILNVDNTAPAVAGIKQDGSAPNNNEDGNNVACKGGIQNGTQLFSCLFPYSVVKNNVFLGTAGTQSQLNNTSTGWATGGPSAYPNANWSGNFVPSNPQMNPGYTIWTADGEGRALANLVDATIKDASGTFISGRQGGIETPGVIMDKLVSAQGTVLSAAANGIGTTTATVSFYAPDSASCPVDISSTDVNVVSGVTRFSDAGGNRQRAVSLTGLSTGTRYYAKVQCAVQQPVVLFHTK